MQIIQLESDNMDILEDAIKTEKRFFDRQLVDKGIYSLELLNREGKPVMRFVLKEEKI